MGSTVSSDAGTSKENTRVSDKSPGGERQRGSDRERGGRRRDTEKKARMGAKQTHSGLRNRRKAMAVHGRRDHWYIASYLESWFRRRVGHSLRARGWVKW